MSAFGMRVACDKIEIFMNARYETYNSFANRYTAIKGMFDEDPRSDPFTANRLIALEESDVLAIKAILAAAEIKDNERVRLKNIEYHEGQLSVLRENQS
jgi:hypothetical protein